MIDSNSLGTLPMIIRARIYLYRTYLASYTWRSSGTSSWPLTMVIFENKLCRVSIEAELNVDCLTNFIQTMYYTHWHGAQEAKKKVAKSVDLPNYITFCGDI